MRVTWNDNAPIYRQLRAAVGEPHRLRLYMPYYSVGRVLTHARKN